MFCLSFQGEQHWGNKLKFSNLMEKELVYFSHTSPKNCYYHSTFWCFVIVDFSMHSFKITALNIIYLDYWAHWCPRKFCAQAVCFIYPTLVPTLSYGLGIYQKINFASGKFIYGSILVCRHSLVKILQNSGLLWWSLSGVALSSPIFFVTKHFHNGNPMETLYRFLMAWG